MHLSLLIFLVSGFVYADEPLMVKQLSENKIWRAEHAEWEKHQADWKKDTPRVEKARQTMAYLMREPGFSSGRFTLETKHHEASIAEFEKLTKDPAQRSHMNPAHETFRTEHERAKAFNDGVARRHQELLAICNRLEILEKESKAAQLAPK